MYANDNLAKELYQLSGWWDDENGRNPGEPLYSLGYLLRKLPGGTSIAHLKSGGWTCKLMQAPRTFIGSYVSSYNPEDAACSLAIELFKQGILK